MQKVAKVEDITDQKIVAYLQECKGARAITIARAVGLKESTARYRLLTLQLADVVQAVKQRGQVVYYATNQ